MEAGSSLPLAYLCVFVSVFVCFDLYLCVFVFVFHIRLGTISISMGSLPLDSLLKGWKDKISVPNPKVWEAQVL